MSLAAAIDLLACPRCAGPLTLADQVRCPNGHAYDVARQGYVNLSEGPPPRNADTAAMVAARIDFLTAGHYDPIADALSELVPASAEAVVDAGAGPGYYGARILASNPTRRGVALDVSVPAVRRAVRAHPRLTAVVADVWRSVPVRDGVVDAVLSVFAPRNPPEFVRVLRAGGVLLTATPAPDHLAELRTDLGLLDHQSDKADQLARGLTGTFEPEGQRLVRLQQTWDAATARASVLMGPNAFHLEAAELDRRLAGLRWPRTMTVSVRLDQWVRRD